MANQLFNPFSLEGKTILVTGASSGIGKGIAIACSKMGAVTIITGRNEERLYAVLSELYGDSNMAVRADLTKEDEIASLLRQIPQLDGVVHCAGIGQRKPCKMITSADIDEVMNINFKSSVLLQALLLQEKNKKIIIYRVYSFQGFQFT